VYDGLLEHSWRMVLGIEATEAPPGWYRDVAAEMPVCCRERGHTAAFSAPRPLVRGILLPLLLFFPLLPFSSKASEQGCHSAMVCVAAALIPATRLRCRCELPPCCSLKQPSCVARLPAQFSILPAASAQSAARCPCLLLLEERERLSCCVLQRQM